MTVEGCAAGDVMPGRLDLAGAVRGLLARMTAEPWGQASASVYETGRLVALAPWLTGHAGRLSFLLAGQGVDGGWGGPEGYGLVPTLSATESLLATLTAIDAGRHSRDRVVDLAVATDRGLRALVDRIGRLDAASIPDTPAVDLIVPALVAAVNERLDRLRGAPLTGLDAWRGDRRLDLPAGMDGRRLHHVRRRLAAGASVPEKLCHALEVAGALARGARGVGPVPPGTVGASPAATAAWFGAPDPAGASPDPDGRAGASPPDAVAARTYLETVARRQGGPVPCATPITVFERSWVLAGLARAGVPGPVPTDLTESLRAALGVAGTPAGPGLPADADTTAVVLYALGRLGVRVEPASLWAYDVGSHFCTWPGEDGFSLTTNAHVLDAFGQHVAGRPDAPPRYLAALDTLSAALADHQRPDGAWFDRWHASPYYATACCALALADYGRSPAAVEAVARAVDWVVATQRPDGSWGRWAGTAEETAYALQVLLAPGGPPRPGVGAAASRGYDFLAAAGAHLFAPSAGHLSGPPDPPLWHDKDLYLPATIVRAAALAALHRARARSDLVRPSRVVARQ